MRRYKSLDIEERLRIYEETMNLRKKGLTCKEIQRIIKEKYNVQIGLWKISEWVHGVHPFGRYNRIVEGSGLAYVIGAWLGDGRLALDRKRAGYFVKLAVKDYDFAEEWGRRLAEALGRSKPYTPRWDDSLQTWVVKGSSILLYNLLKRAKVDPWILMIYL